MRRLLLLASLLAALAAAPSASAWTWPVDGPVLSTFLFDRAHPYDAGQRRGIDIGADPGTGVVAAAGGIVSFAGTVPGSGRSVTIQTPDGYSVTETQLGSIGAMKGTSVAEGAQVGSVGSNASMHLGIRITSDPQGYLDPLAFLPPREPVVAPVVAEPAPVPAEAPTEDAAPAVDQVAPADTASVEPAPTDPAPADDATPVIDATTVTTDNSAVGEPAPAPVDATSDPASVSEPSTSATEAPIEEQDQTVASAPEPDAEAVEAPTADAGAAADPPAEVPAASPAEDPAPTLDASAPADGAGLEPALTDETAAIEPVAAVDATSVPAADSAIGEAMSTQEDPADEPAPPSEPSASTAEAPIQEQTEPVAPAPEPVGEPVDALTADDAVGSEPPAPVEPTVLEPFSPVVELTGDASASVPAAADEPATADALSEAEAAEDVAATLEPTLAGAATPTEPSAAVDAGAVVTGDSATADTVPASVVSVDGPAEPSDPTAVTTEAPTQEQTEPVASAPEPDLAADIWASDADTITAAEPVPELTLLSDSAGLVTGVGSTSVEPGLAAAGDEAAASAAAAEEAASGDAANEAQPVEDAGLPADPPAVVTTAGSSVEPSGGAAAADTAEVADDPALTASARSDEQPATEAVVQPTALPSPASVPSNEQLPAVTDPGTAASSTHVSVTVGATVAPEPQPAETGVADAAGSDGRSLPTVQPMTASSATPPTAGFAPIADVRSESHAAAASTPVTTAMGRPRLATPSGRSQPPSGRGAASGRKRLGNVAARAALQGKPAQSPAATDAIADRPDHGRGQVVHHRRAPTDHRPTRLAPALLLLGLLLVAGGAAPLVRIASRRSPKPAPIMDGDALLPDNTDLLRQLDAAHRPRVYDDRGRHPRAPSSPARRRHVLPDGDGRERDEERPLRRGGRCRPEDIRRPARRGTLAPAARPGRRVSRLLHSHDR
jgi:hypothetical protein